MSITPTLDVQHRLQTLAGLAHLLQRLEVSHQVDAGQYRAVVQRLTALLQADWPVGAVETVLQAFPAAAEVYENLVYDQAGLALHPLELSVDSELAARACIAAVSGP
jgi:hypothetical protein